MIIFFKKYCHCFDILKSKMKMTREPLLNQDSKSIIVTSYEEKEDSMHSKYEEKQALHSSKSEQNLQSNGIEDFFPQEETLLIPQKYIRSDEEGKIVFTQRGILDLVSKIREETTQGKWIYIFDKDRLKMDYKNGSFLSNNLILGRILYEMPKSDFKKELDYDLLKKFMYEPEIRMKYDKGIKEFRILENGENYCIFYTLLHSPVFFIAERDLVDKRIEFTKDNIYYNLSTSVFDYLPLDAKAVRINTYLNLLILSQDEKNYYFECYSQYDAKTIIPEKLLNMTVPSRTQDWFKNYIDEINTFLEKDFKNEIEE